MGFALKKGLFGASLHKTSLILLNIQVVICVLTSLEKFSDQNGVIDKLMKGDICDWAAGVLLVKSLTIECYIFMVAIWSIIKKKSTNTVLKMTLIVILLNSLYLIYVIAVINLGVHHALKENSVDGYLREVSFPHRTSELNRHSIIDFLINCYTAMIIYSYCVELQTRRVATILPICSSVHYKRESDSVTDAPPAYEDLEAIAPLRIPDEMTSSV